MSYIFDPTRCLAVVNAWPDHRTSPHLDAWLQHIGIGLRQIITHNYGEPNKGGMMAAYNRSCRTALESTAGHFIFADADARPAPVPMAPWVESTADVVSAVCKTECHDAFDAPDAFHTILWRCSRAVLEAVHPPRFDWAWNADWTDTVGCLCQGFRAKVQRLGFNVAAAGAVGHTPASPPVEPRSLSIGDGPCIFR